MFPTSARHWVAHREEALRKMIEALRADNGNLLRALLTTLSRACRNVRFNTMLVPYTP